MHLRDLVVLYLLVGLACAVRVWRTAPARDAGLWVSALTTLLIWPLWAPFALARR